MILLEYVCAIVHRPYGTLILYRDSYPTLKRGANQPCAYGACVPLVLLPGLLQLPHHTEVFVGVANCHKAFHLIEGLCALSRAPQNAKEQD